MSKRMLALVFAVAVMAGLAGRALVSWIGTVQPALAQQETRRTDVRQWEYCAVTRAAFGPSIKRSTYTITYFRPSGVQIVDVDESVIERNALPKAIARLGEDGWEMVGDGPVEFRAGPSIDALYFKRRKP